MGVDSTTANRAMALFVAAAFWCVLAAARPGSNRRRRFLALRGGASLEEESNSSASWPPEEDEEENLALALALKQSADAAQRKGELRRARPIYLEALAAAETSPSRSRLVVVAQCQLNLARCCSKLGDDYSAVDYCDAALRAVEKGLGPVERPLRAAALYRRAVARAALGDSGAATADAQRALALGEARAAALLRRVQPQPQLANLLADPERLASLVPVAKTFATPEALQSLGIDRGRAGALANFVGNLESEAVELWLRRAKVALRVYQRLAKVVKLAAMLGPLALYTAFLAYMAADSYKLLLAA